MISEQDAKISIALIQQVSACVRPYKTEADVTTIITRPMWRVFCRFAGIPQDLEPTEQWMGKDTRRVYGSRTIVVESDQMAAVSFYGVYA